MKEEPLCHSQRLGGGVICILAGLFWIAHQVDLLLFYSDYRDVVISTFDPVEISLLGGAFLLTAGHRLRDPHHQFADGDAPAHWAGFRNVAAFTGCMVFVQVLRNPEGVL
jgi:hypothetical protein